MNRRLNLARKAIRTAQRHLDEGRPEHAKRAMLFAREMLRETDVDDMREAERDGRVREERRVGA